MKSTHKVKWAMFIIHRRIFLVFKLEKNKNPPSHSHFSSLFRKVRRSTQKRLKNKRECNCPVLHWWGHKVETVPCGDKQNVN